MLARGLKQMGKTKSYEEINEKIRTRQAVVVTAEEVSRMALELSPQEILQKVDVVTTATFGPMCSSGAFINFGHYDPPIRMEEITLNDVPVYAGIAAVDAYIGATSESKYDETYGGAHVIEELIDGKNVFLSARAKGTDCYPTKEVETSISKDTVNEFFLFNPRNAYQNYAVASNSLGHTIYTYMGTLLPRFGNATYSTSGELSPLLNDPDFRTVGIGTRIFFGGTQGFVSWYGTQFNTSKEKNASGVPVSNAGTISVIGDGKQMSSRYIKAAYMERYGVTLFVGIGIPIPLLDEDLARAVSIRNEQIEATVQDYGIPEKPSLGLVNYAMLRSGSIEIGGKKVRSAPISSLHRAREIASELKRWIDEGSFEISKPVEMFPKHTSTKGLKRR